MGIALIIIDMQRFVTDRIAKGYESHPFNAIDNMRKILCSFRQRNKKIIHVRHQTVEEDSYLHINSILSHPIEGFEEENGEPIFVKKTSSAFRSTDLLTYLKENDIDECIFIGAVAGFCLSSTVRDGADLGLKASVVSDAIISFELLNEKIKAKEILDVTLAVLNADFAKVISSIELI
ncbi:cysteine hydrolase family protein [Enterobacter hormaechei]|uniref:cysteine hydrolase family protein n=1 Tax=Enterobacter hormaechei TaxID=158836 RepID=UPI00263A4B96|nr:isochorismatase family cysteine hydrolase [Enterobacter hormaechei]MDN5006976.1 isochorismatase family cysteine hydrolase [Enterobacter hormaechei]MDO1523448.1 isochorismatase family cysteine hydrolase [Enterobacter hormaechei]